MRQYRVWSDTYGQREEDAREVSADTPQQAAEKWARWRDAWGADYLIVNGAPAEATVKDVEIGRVSVWLVHGEAVREYTAKLRVSDGTTT